MLNPETHPNLGIFKLGAFWHSDEARMALQAVSDFLRYSLALVDDDNSRSLRNNLVTKLEAAGVALSIMSEDYTNELEKLRHEGIDFTFLLDDD